MSFRMTPLESSSSQRDKHVAFLILKKNIPYKQRLTLRLRPRLHHLPAGTWRCLLDHRIKSPRTRQSQRPSPTSHDHSSYKEKQASLAHMIPPCMLNHCSGLAQTGGGGKVSSSRCAPSLASLNPSPLWGSVVPPRNPNIPIYSGNQSPSTGSEQSLAP